MKKQTLLQLLFACCLSNAPAEGLPPLLFRRNEPITVDFINTENGNQISYNDLRITLFQKYREINDYSNLLGNIFNLTILADLDGDGIYEIYENLGAGSGIVRNFFHGYNPVSEVYYDIFDILENNVDFFTSQLNEIDEISLRNKLDILISNNGFMLFVYENQLYICFNFSNPSIFKPVLSNGIILFENIDTDLHSNIIESGIIMEKFYL